MKPYAYKTVSRQLAVTGTLWSGQDADHAYPLGEFAILPRTLADARQLAPDFSGLTAATVETITRRVTETTVRKALK